MRLKEQKQERLRSAQDWPTFLRVDEVIKFKLESSVYLWKLLSKTFFYWKWERAVLSNVRYALTV